VPLRKPQPPSPTAIVDGGLLAAAAQAAAAESAAALAASATQPMEVEAPAPPRVMPVKTIAPMTIGAEDPHAALLRQVSGGSTSSTEWAGLASARSHSTLVSVGSAGSGVFAADGGLSLLASSPTASILAAAPAALVGISSTLALSIGKDASASAGGNMVWTAWGNGVTSVGGSLSTFAMGDRTLMYGVGTALVEGGGLVFDRILIDAEHTREFGHFYLNDIIRPQLKALQEASNAQGEKLVVDITVHDVFHLEGNEDVPGEGDVVLNWAGYQLPLSELLCLPSFNPKHNPIRHAALRTMQKAVLGEEGEGHKIGQFPHGDFSLRCVFRVEPLVEFVMDNVHPGGKGGQSVSV
jgi:hypothetical protein